MAATAVLTSVGGTISLLDEEEDELLVYALEELNKNVDFFWAEIASHITKIETLCEDPDFKSKELASHVASKIFYHLEEFDDALRYALGAGALFDVANDTEYVHTMIAKVIDEYIRLREEAYEKKAELVIDPRLEEIVSRMFDRCYDDGQFKQALGIAVEARNLDQMRTTVQAEGGSSDMLDHLFNLTQSVITSRRFRLEVLELLVSLYAESKTPDYINACQCLLFLNRPQQVADILNTIVQKDGNDSLLAYQIAFDLTENQNTPFMLQVMNALPNPEDHPDNKEVVAKAIKQAEARSKARKEKFLKAQKKREALEKKKKKQEEEAKKAEEDAKTEKQQQKVEDKKEKQAAKNEKVEADIVAAEEKAGDPDTYKSDPDIYPFRMHKLKEILSSKVSTALWLHFLYGQSRSDLGILMNIKNKVEERNSVTHYAVVCAQAITNCGSTIDTFLRDNLEWLGKATNWAKFSATASLGVIHRGHHAESIKLLSPYLPVAGQSSSPYSQGGALYALGLIHSNDGGSQIEYLSEKLTDAGPNEIIQHGACLGMGLTAMATQREDIYERLKAIAFDENAVAGEAAGLSMGLTRMGSGDGDSLTEMLTYAQETQHEKTQRGLMLGMALIMYGREEGADGLIEQLLRDKDPLIRIGGTQAVASAYACTANNAAIQRLLHLAVSDVSDNVRRYAVMGLGYVLANEPEQLPRVVSLLSESFNPHVRYGAAMAVGIACAGTGLTTALDLLEPILTDSVGWVRQAAFIGMAMVLMQHNGAQEPRVEKFRQTIDDSVVRKESMATLSNLGAILAAGILDAGGRNLTISLQSAAGHKKQAAIAGMLVFPQFWYWFPLTHFISLAFTPSAVLGLNADLEMPAAFSFASNAKPSLYAYPEIRNYNKEEKKVQTKKATLSVSARVRGKKGRAEAKLQEAKAKEEEAKKAAEEKALAETKKKAEAEKGPEPEFEILKNPARVTKKQFSLLSLVPNQRYTPVKKTLSGIALLTDSTPQERQEIVFSLAPKIGVPGISDDEPEPPEPFEFLR